VIGQEIQLVLDTLNVELVTSLEFKILQF